MYHCECVCSWVCVHAIVKGQKTEGVIMSVGVRVCGLLKKQGKFSDLNQKEVEPFFWELGTW